MRLHNHPMRTHVLGVSWSLSLSLLLPLSLSLSGAWPAHALKPQAPQPGASVETKPEPAAAPPAVPVKKKHEPLGGYATYDGTLDGKKQLTDALVTARTENKRVLVMFGGNWCKWCKALDATMAANETITKLLETSYLFIHIDSDSNLALNTELGDPFKNGFPVLVVFNDDGTVKKIQETGSLEKDDKSVGHDPEKVRAFLAVHAKKKG
jgi:thiol-disulfide isomerase/thioredoxin